MGTVNNSLTSTASTPVTSSTSSGSMFTGTSQYSQDFQNVITRAVAIASLPITLLTNQQTTLTNESTALTKVDTDFTALQTAVQGIQAALDGSSFETTISAPTVVSASVADGAQQGNYSIDVLSPGAYQSSLTTTTWASTGAAATYTLVVGGSDYTVSATDDSAATVAAAINTQYGNLVDASAVNVGTSTTPDYRISLQSATLGPVSVDIQKTLGVSLQTQQTPPGSLASYEVDGSGQTEYSDSDTISIAAGLTLNLLAVGTTNVTVTRSTSALSDALSTFANAYNTAAADVAAQRGTSSSTGAGALQGQAIVFDLSQALSSMGIYNSTSGQVSNLEQLGLDLGVNGQFTYSPLTMEGTDLANSSEVTSFLGSSTANANSLTAKTWVTTGNPATYTLVVGSSNYSVSATDDSAATVAAAIDAQHGTLVQASVVNQGTTETPDYRISLQSIAPGAMNVDILNSSGTSLQTQQATSGSGFLGVASNALNNLEDPTTGEIKTTEANLTSESSDIGAQISTKQAQVDTLQTNLENQMTKADAAIASMEQQYTYMTDMFQAEQTEALQYANE
jgi:flagellar hook-associated protein 2